MVKFLSLQLTTAQLFTLKYLVKIIIPKAFDII